MLSSGEVFVVKFPDSFGRIDLSSTFKKVIDGGKMFIAPKLTVESFGPSKISIGFRIGMVRFLVMPSLLFILKV